MKFCSNAAAALVTLMIAATPAWTAPNYKKIREKMDKLSDGCQSLNNQNACRKLEKFAVEDKDAYVRLAAARRLTDRALQAKIAVEDTDPGVRYAAVMGLTDRALQAKIALGDKDAEVRSKFVKFTSNVDSNPKTDLSRLASDQALLAKVAVEDEDAGVRTAAVQALGSPKWMEGSRALLAKIAVEDKVPNVRSAAKFQLEPTPEAKPSRTERRDCTPRTHDTLTHEGWQRVTTYPCGDVPMPLHCPPGYRCEVK